MLCLVPFRPYLNHLASKSELTNDHTAFTELVDNYHVLHTPLMLFTSSKLLKTVQYCPMFHVLGRCFAKAPLLKVVEAQRVLLRQKAPVHNDPAVN